MIYGALFLFVMIYTDDRSLANAFEKHAVWIFIALFIEYKIAYETPRDSFGEKKNQPFVPLITEIKLLAIENSH